MHLIIGVYYENTYRLNSFLSYCVSSGLKVDYDEFHKYVVELDCDEFYVSHCDYHGVRVQCLLLKQDLSLYELPLSWFDKVEVIP